MSRATFDPNNFRVEDLFRAKEERRQRLAKLPFEEKIKIVEKLQRDASAAMKNEKLIFDSFLRACPDFAGEPIAEWDVVDDWYAKRELDPPPNPFDKRPDIIALTTSGRKIGIELKSWVNREQIKHARGQEQVQENILKAIGEQLPNETKHLGYVRLSAKQVRFDSRDAALFREQLFSLIEHVDSSWLQQLDAYQEQFLDSDFTGFPILGKYLHYIQCHPGTRRPSDSDWIGFHFRGGAYSPNEMLGTLRRSLVAHRTDKKYQDLRKHVGLDEVYLLVHYDFKAFAYNTPFDAPNFGFKEAAKFASGVLGGDGGYFDRVFLFHFLWGQEEAHRIFPGPVSKR
jgi:hypothetical protein